jgi:chromosome partitioning protein
MRIAVTSPKGGAGRTTLVLNLGVTLSERGLRVAMIDLDPQGGLGFHLARKDDEWAGVADLLMGRVTLDQAVKRSNRALLALLPRGRLDPCDACEFEQALRKPDVLRAALANLDRHFDVILMDLPAGVGMIPRGALTVATHVVIAVPAETAAVRSLNRMFRVIEEVRSRENERLSVMAVMPTMVGPGSDAALEIFEAMDLPYYVNGIPRSPAFRVAAEKGQPLSPELGDDCVQLRSIRGLGSLINRRLKEADSSFEPKPVQPLAGGSRYLDFSSERFSPRRSGSVNQDGEGGGELRLAPVTGMSGLAEWRGFLDTCLKATGAETAFVMDSQGLTLATRGRLHSGQIEGLGTRLMIAYEQAASMEIAAGEVHGVLVEFEHLWLTGLRTETRAGQRYTIGILGGEPVGPKAREQIREGIRSLRANEESIAIPVEL